MKHKLTTLAAALDLRVFDLEQLAAKAGVPKDTVQTVLSRQSRAHPGWVARSTRARGVSGRPRVTYELTSEGARAIAKELDQFARATVFTAERAPTSAPPLGLVRAEQAFNDLEQSGAAGDSDGLVTHILRNLDWARNELANWKDSGASPWQYFERLTSLQQRALELTSKALRMRGEQSPTSLDVELPREVFLGPFVDNGRSQELAHHATMCLHAAGRILALNQFRVPIVRGVRDVEEFRVCLASLSREPHRGARREIVSAQSTRIFMCVDSGGDMHQLRAGLSELAGMHVALDLVMLDVQRNHLVAELAAGVNAAYRAEALADLSWVDDLRAPHPTDKLARARVIGSGSTQDLSALPGGIEM